MNLLDYWLEEKIKPRLKQATSPLGKTPRPQILKPSSHKKISKLPNFAIPALLLALIFFFLGRYSQNINPLPPTTSPAPLNLPEIDLSPLNLSPQPATSNQAPATSPPLRLLSATLIPIYEQSKESPTPQASKKITAPRSYISYLQPALAAQEPPSPSPTLSPAPSNQAPDTSNQPPGTSNQQTSPSAASHPTPQAPTSKLAGLRILGEYQNTSSETIENIQALVYFFDEKGTLIAKKRAQQTSPFRFLPTEPEEITLYDILVANPPSAARLQIDLQPKTSTPNQQPGTSNQAPGTRHQQPGTSYQPPGLKLKNKSLKEKTANSQGEEITYYQFQATLKNVSEQTLTSPLIYLWAKDEKNKVFAAAYKELTYDILAPADELKISLPLIPLKKAELADYEIKLWAKPL